MEKELYIDFANETIYENTLRNGIKCFVIPKKGFKEKQVMFAVDYGSVDTIFLQNGDLRKEPDGIAHFIEHKLFEQEDYNVFEAFSKYGASSNAFTNFNTTAYYFNCTENFKENIDILFDFVSKPYFTKENVEKEMDIISQEIRMYDDDPSWKIYFNMLKAMYENHNVKNDIAGTVDTIKNITEEALYENYKNFYTYKNSVVVCVGDFDRNIVYESIEKNLKLNADNNIKKADFDEKKNIVKKVVSEEMSVERTMFNIGIKDTSEHWGTAKRILGTKILLDIIVGESSEFYEDMYNKRIIDKSFTYAYTCGRDYGFAIISGFSEKPDIIEKNFLNNIIKVKNQGINSDLFEIIKNKYLGRFIKGFNSVDGIAAAQVDFFTKGITLYDYANCCKNINIEYIEEILYDLFPENNIVLSLIVPYNNSKIGRE